MLLLLHIKRERVKFVLPRASCTLALQRDADQSDYDRSGKRGQTILTTQED